MHADTLKRRASMLSQSLIPEGGNYSLDYTKSPLIKGGMTSSPRGYVPGEHMHHTAIVDVYEPIFRNTHPTEAGLLNDIAASKGVYMGNHPKNFVSMEESDHLSGMHGYAGDIRMQLNNLSKKDRAEMDIFLNKIADAPFGAKKEALLTMIEYGQPIMDDRLKQLGYEFKSRNQLAEEYKQEMKADHQQARRESAIDRVRREVESRQHLSKTGKQLRGQKLSEARIEDLLNMDKDIPISKTMRTQKRFASKPAVEEAARQTYGGSSRSESPGTNRERALIIEAGGDVNIGPGVLRSNGKNGKNDNGH